VRRRRVVAILVPLLVVIHLFLHLGLGIGKAAPDFMTVALLLAAREVGMGAGGALGFSLGLLEDSFSVLAFGANTLALTIVGILGARTRDFFVGESRRFFFTYLVAGKLLRNLIHWLAAGERVRAPFLNAVVVDGTVAAVYCAVLGVLLLLPFERKGALR
jgi:cell shape-determining protein MreD